MLWVRCGTRRARRQRNSQEKAEGWVPMGCGTGTPAWCRTEWFPEAVLHPPAQKHVLKSCHDHAQEQSSSNATVLGTLQSKGDLQTLNKDTQAATAVLQGG